MLLMALFLGAATLLGACAPTGSKGTMPPPGPDGQIDPSAVPDFVAIAGDSGVVGYVRKDAVLGGSADRAWPVYGEDLHTVVGELVPGRGFVPAGSDPNLIPTADVSVGPAGMSEPPSSGVIAYVRNGSPREATIAVLADGKFEDGAGFWPDGYVGVACLQMPVGSQLVLLDRLYTEPGAAVVSVVYVREAGADTAIRWLDIGTDGRPAIGSGQPDWWAGDPPPC
jgi:hypothetical protein